MSKGDEQEEKYSWRVVWGVALGCLTIGAFCGGMGCIGAVVLAHALCGK